MTKKFERAVQLYEILDRQAKDEKTDDNKKVRVFRGSLTDLYYQLGFGPGHYSPTWKILYDLGCVTMLQRGAKSVQSVMILHHAPDHAEYLQTRDQGKQDLTRRQDYATLSADIQAIKRQIGGIDIRNVLLNLEQRIASLEGKDSNAT